MCGRVLMVQLDNAKVGHARSPQMAFDVSGLTPRHLPCPTADCAELSPPPLLCRHSDRCWCMPTSGGALCPRRPSLSPPPRCSWWVTSSREGRRRCWSTSNTTSTMHTQRGTTRCSHEQHRHDTVTHHSPQLLRLPPLFSVRAGAVGCPAVAHSSPSASAMSAERYSARSEARTGV